MSTTGDKVYVARLVGTSVFDPLGDAVGRVRDVVLLLRSKGGPSAVGLVVEVPGRRRVFLPLTRVTSIAAGQVICTGVVNLRRFQTRTTETLAVGELFEREVALKDGTGNVFIEDVAIVQTRARTWSITDLFVRREGKRRGPLGFGRRGHGMVVPVTAVRSLQGSKETQGAALIIQSFEDYKPADVAAALMEMSPARKVQIAEALDDHRLADVIEELPESDQVKLVSALKPERAADVLEEMEPDDAADLLGDLPKKRAAALLGMMEPEGARSVRQLLHYDDDVAGGLMTTEPVLVGPESTVANALALVRRSELTPALASMVFVVRPPAETPTGRYLGLVHLQRLLREAPHDAIGDYVDPAIEPMRPSDHLSAVARTMAAYDIMAVPVVDDDGHLVGAISADDVLDHLLPDDWRENTDAQPTTGGARG